MPRAIKCDACGKFEDNTGYSIKVVKLAEGSKLNGDFVAESMVFYTENICSECSQKVRDILQPDHE